MKTIEHMSKQELESAFRHQFKDIYWKEPVFDCACCGSNINIPFMFICDKCDSILKEKKVHKE
jgi:hypothetical protein